MLSRIFKKRAEPAGNKLARFKKDKRGVTAVEFAILAVPYFMLIFGILETGLVMLGGQLLDHATAEAARFVRTGQAQGKNKAALTTIICSSSANIFCLKPDRLSVSVKDFTSFKEVADVPAPKYDPKSGKWDFHEEFKLGSRNSIMLLRVNYRWPMMTEWMKSAFADNKSGDRVLSSSAVFRNEPF
ncbi:TadE/TadG family type IV pilus assembly protein [Polycladidibacter stylochi]|uniref:TadE/TadG family type IV pilus assembly protein n=1 Tax=Polycladidibacter stylochi TaxID=1807766 RepID=UPI000831A4BC|nr:TadE/TadG family type IV pilus assembly protein [Pseudovibrio stylochi]